MRKKGTTVEWTTKLVRQVAELRGKGYTATEIAEMMGLPYGAVKGKLDTLIAAGEIPKRVAPRRYTPTDVRDRKIRTLTDHILDWVWAHPGARFKMINLRVGDNVFFSFHYEGEDGIYRCIGVSNNPHWSEFVLCTADNLRTLLAALRRIDAEAGNND